MGWFIFWIALVLLFGGIVQGDHRQADVPDRDRPLYCEKFAPADRASLSECNTEGRAQ